MDSIVPMLGEDNAATPMATRVKAMVTAAAIQQHEQTTVSHTRTHATSHTVNSRPQSGQERGRQHKGEDARDNINCNRDARNVINNRRREREEGEQ